MALKQTLNSLMAPDGSQYVTLTDGGGNLLPSSGTGATTQVVGDSASGAADSASNPVKVGGKFSTSLPVLTNNQRGDLQVDSNANLRTVGVLTQQAGTDAFANTNLGQPYASGSLGVIMPVVASSVFNGTSWDRSRGDVNGTYVGGNVASGVADAGNPVKAGGRYNTTTPTLTNGQRGDLQLGTRGALNVTLTQVDGTNGVQASAVGSDGFASQSALYTNGFGLAYNGATYDRNRNNVDTGALVALAAVGAGTVNGADQTNYNGTGIQVIVDVTVATAMTLTINIQGKDAISGKYYTILSSAAYSTVATNQLIVYPGATVTANVSASQPLPRTWRVQAVVTGTSVTATVGASVIL